MERDTMIVAMFRTYLKPLKLQANLKAQPE
jgi:hypothetical protein